MTSTSSSGSKFRLRVTAIEVLLIGLFASSLWAAEVAAAPRNFHMALWQSSDRAYTDLSWFWLGGTQPSRPAILRLDGAYNDSQVDLEELAQMLANPAHDWSKIVAVWIDEPYWNAVGSVGENDNPCSNSGSERYAAMESMAARLAQVAEMVKNLSPSTRFWVNFSVPEMQWMVTNAVTPCPYKLNESYIDVVSMDRYRPFNEVKPYYDWLKTHPATGYQQRALVALVASKESPNAVDPSTAASWLQGYFDYATTENQTCDLPIGRTGITNIGDRCSVWVVSGWPGVDYTVAGYVGLFVPSSAPIREAWYAQHRIVRSEQMIAVFNAFDSLVEQ